MIYVCDAIMGSGKSSAAITYMNEHPQQRYMYVTPYIAETERIRNACPELHFKIPSTASSETNHTKRDHLKLLLTYGENVSMSHVLLALCDNDTVAIIKEQHYTIIIDEALSVMDKIPAKADDVKLAMNSEWFQCDIKRYDVPYEVTMSASGCEYTGNWMRDLKLYANSHRLVALRDRDGNDKLYCWMLDETILRSADNLFILTYMFNAAPLSATMQMYGLGYEYIGVVHEHGAYRFSWDSIDVPAYTANIKSMIHIYHSDKMNQCGDKINALSMNWQTNAAKDKRNGWADEIQKNLRNYFRNIHRDTPLRERMWSCSSVLKNKVSGGGYGTRFVEFNARATNDYRHTRVLAYCMNVYMPLWEKTFYGKHGVEMSDDEYGLSVMIQWIWRSAIRDGKEIWIYIPSRRMRELLEQWLDNVSKGLVGGSAAVLASPDHNTATRLGAVEEESA